jgi:hypothetical protein
MIIMVESTIGLTKRRRVKVQPQAFIIYFIMGMLTLGYTMIISLGLSIFNNLYDPR